MCEGVDFVTVLTQRLKVSLVIDTSRDSVISYSVSISGAEILREYVTILSVITDLVLT